MRTRRVQPRGVLAAFLVFALVFAVAGCNGISGPAASATPAGTPQPPASTASPVAVPWPAPPHPMALAVAAGLEPGPKEYLTNHVHAHLDVFIDGEPIAVPSGIGINIDDPAVRHVEQPDGTISYGGITLCAQPCISPLHTHDWNGIIHTESATPESNTLGQFFTEWGVPLSRTCVGEHCSPESIAFYVNGEPYTGDPAAIELTDRKEIAIVIGTPPAHIPTTADFSNA